MLRRYKNNPILKPIKDHPWESKRVFNCAAVYDGGAIHILYRAQGGENGVSKLGYACSSDGYHIDERLKKPVFSPLPDNFFEAFGCEDPRLTKMGDKYYMCYTAYGRFRRWRRAGSKMRLAQVGITSISVEDFLNRRWNWGARIYPFPRVDSKNCALFPERVNGLYAIYHRIPPHVWIAYSAKIDDWSNSNHKIVMSPREPWESMKVGAGAPPIKTEKGWLIVYHGVDDEFTYRLGLALADLRNPEKVVRLKEPILEPKEDYEGRIVFSCGATVMDGRLFVYYGANDRVVCVATANVSELLGLFEERGLV